MRGPDSKPYRNHADECPRDANVEGADDDLCDQCRRATPSSQDHTGNSRGRRDASSSALHFGAEQAHAAVELGSVHQRGRGETWSAHDPLANVAAPLATHVEPSAHIGGASRRNACMGCTARSAEHPPTPEESDATGERRRERRRPPRPSSRPPAPPRPGGRPQPPGGRPRLPDENQSPRYPDLPIGARPRGPVDDFLGVPDSPDPPAPPWEPHLLADCHIEFPPPPSGAVNPDLPPPQVGDFASGIRIVDPPPGSHFGLTARGARASSNRNARLGFAAPGHTPVAPTVIDDLLAPEKPLCPPDVWSFDYEWQSCWPSGVPHDPPPPGTQWPHACLCSPDYSWLATEGRCWKRGSRPGFSFDLPGTLTGHKPTPGGPQIITFHDPAYVEMPYRTFVFDASEERVAQVFDAEPHYSDITTIKRLGIKDTDDWELEDRCHTQGIAHCGDRVVTSCMRKGYSQNPENYSGLLQFYEYIDIHHFSTAYQDYYFPGGAIWSQRVLSQPWPHAVAGQSIRGAVVSNSLGVVHTQFMDRFLFPVGSEDSHTDPPAPEDMKTNVRVYDKHGTMFPEMEFFTRSGYACGALFHYQLAGEEHPELYLLIVDKDGLSLIHYPWDGIGLRFGAPISRIFKTKGTVKSDLRYANLLSKGHQAVNFFYAREGGEDKLYLIGTHGNSKGRDARWMETYRFRIFVEEGVWQLDIDRIALARYPEKTYAGFGLFYEGVAIQPLEGNKMRVWCAANDYRASRCVPPDDNIKCTHLLYFERRF